MFPNAGIMAAGVNTGPTYEDFDAAITALAVNGTKIWNEPKSFTAGFQLKIRTVASADALGEMSGSPYGSWFWTYATWGRMAQHCLPSEAMFNAIIAAGHAVYMEGSYEPHEEATGLNRNGYQSTYYGPHYDNYMTIIDFRWYDAEAKKAWKYNPRTMSAPVEFIL